MSDYQATNAASSGIKLDKKTTKALMRRNDEAGLKWLATWVAMLLGTGFVLYLSMDSAWWLLATLVYGAVLSVPSYSLSHECAHGTAFRNRTLNEVLFWISSFLYFEEPNHRRFSHARHHTYTWINKKDSQMPFATPMNLKGWLLEVSGIGLVIYEGKLFIQLALGKFSAEVLDYTPASELDKLKSGARWFVAGYLAIAIAILAGADWLWYYLVLPRIVGGIVMLLFTLVQHVEMEEDQLDIRRSTRSCKTNWLGRFLYMNMNYHIEHHLYPTVPFHALPALNKEVKDQLPEPDPGFIRTNLEVLSIVTRRSLSLNTRSRLIRQSANMY